MVVVLLATPACGSASSRSEKTKLLPVGALAPDLAAYDRSDRETRLSSLRGHYVTVYFYPKDATPGCTKEACAFRDAWDRLKRDGIVVIGVSADSRESHR